MCLEEIMSITVKQNDSTRLQVQSVSTQYNLWFEHREKNIHIVSTVKRSTGF